MRRSLRAIEVVLAVAREDERTSSWSGQSGVPLAWAGPEIAAEVESYAEEARGQGKGLVLDFDDFGKGSARVNALVPRQALGILLDNAIRHAVPGRIDVNARVEGSELVMRVRDQGPGLSATQSSAIRNLGAGLGLRLLHALLARVDGGCEVEIDSPRAPASPCIFRSSWTRRPPAGLNRRVPDVDGSISVRGTTYTYG
jgi:signal transduction histidine kinase